MADIDLDDLTPSERAAMAVAVRDLQLQGRRLGERLMAAGIGIERGAIVMLAAASHYAQAHAHAGSDVHPRDALFGALLRHVQKGAGLSVLIDADQEQCGHA